MASRRRPISMAAAVVTPPDVDTGSASQRWRVSRGGLPQSFARPLAYEIGAFKASFKSKSSMHIDIHVDV